MGRTYTARGTWLLAGFLLLGVTGQVVGQVRIAPAVISPAAVGTSSAAVGNVLHRAEKLEGEHRWGEALSIYEEALREFPDEPTLGSRHTLAKIHYDLGRRYTDSSFLRAVTSLNERDALNLYSEVLLKIESHYVTPPDWGMLVARGTQGMQVALAETAFQQQHLRNATRAQIDAFSAQLQTLLSARRVQSRQQAMDLVTAAVGWGRQQLQLAPASISMEFACGAIGALDSYSSYLTSDQLTDVYSQIEGNFVGLGIELKAGEGGLQIVKVISGSPADRAGIRAGDRITDVDGQSTIDLSTDQAADKLQGREGSIVELTTLTPAGVSRRLRIRREHVEVPSVDDVRIVDRDFGVGYLKLTCFQKTTSRDLDAALWKLHRDGMRSLIIDLRGNPGGLLTSSVEVADKFVDEGIIVATRGRSSLEDYNYTAHKAGTWHVPLVVLIDDESASASEIFAGAIRDHRRGQLVGERSYGKGSVQGIFPLTTANSGVRLTTAKFYSPNGHPISNVGVTPDVTVQAVAGALAGQLAAQGGPDDVVLNAGVQAARRQVAKR
ncbi:MAG: S41 family peptidase [Pirellulales bacterium]